MQSQAASLAALDGHYQLHFAGRPRATRDLAMLDAMLASLPASESGQRAEAWQRERDAIAEAQRRLGDQGLALARTLERLALVQARVHRAAAVCGPADFTEAELTALLAEVIAAAKEAQGLRWPAGLTAVLGPEQARLLAALSTSKVHLLEWQRASRAAVATDADAAAADAPSRARLAAAVVGRAQRLLARFAAQVTGRLQPAVRPALLSTLADGLDEMATALVPLCPPGVEEEAHAANCRALAEQAAHWRSESVEGQRVRRHSSAGELVALLLDEADAILAATDDVSSDPAAQAASFAWLGNRMDEVFRQLDELPTAFGLGSHAQATLGIIDCVQFLDARLAEVRADH